MKADYNKLTNILLAVKVNCYFLFGHLSLTEYPCERSKLTLSQWGQYILFSDVFILLLPATTAVLGSYLSSPYS